MRSIETGSAYAWVGRDGMLWARKMTTNGIVHRMMVVLMQRWQSRGLCVPQLILFLFSTLSGSHHSICPRLICWVIQESTNIVNK